MNAGNKGAKYSYGLVNHWVSYILGMGAFILMIVLSSFVDPFLFPIISLVIAFILFVLIRINRRRDSMSCMLIPYIIARTLAEYTAIFFLIAIVLYFTDDKSVLIKPKGEYIDFIDFPILLLSSILMINTVIVSLKKNKCTFCALCLLRNGTPSERGVAGRIQSIETIRLVRQIFILSLIFSIASWTYFIFLYNNANINDFDRLVFTGVPFLLWIIHAISVAIRCWVLVGYCARRKDLGAQFMKGNSLLRYLVVCDNKLYIAHYGSDTPKGKQRIDTPISSYIPFQKHVPLQVALSNLENLIGVSDGNLKFLYSFTDDNNECSVNHYIYFMESLIDIEHIKGEWVSLNSVEVAFSKNELNGALKTEIYRLYTAMSAYKTYNPDGSRKFIIKGYKPSFSFDDLRVLDIDYTDPDTMLLSVNNEDVKFYKIKKWWFKNIEGIID